MDTYIEEIFRRKAEMTDHCILVAQWEYDKRLLPDALKAINQVFPHYSLHDESHSISILNNIVNVLGKDTIVQLNCMDLWLILETAYWHDLGMVVTADMILEALEDDFPNYFRYLLANPSAGSVKYSSFFKLHDNKLMFKDAAFSVEAYIIRKSKFPQNPKRSVRFSGKGTKRSVQKRKARNTQKTETEGL